jgi:hypothetical protein
LANDTVRAHGLTPEERVKRLQEMEAVARRHLIDADTSGLSADGKHNIAYTAARVAAEMVMVAEGFRAGRRTGKHASVFAFLAAVDEGRWSAEARYFDRCRRRRNISEYEQAHTVSPTEADAVAQEAERLLGEVLEWVGEAHSHPASEERE